MGAQPGNCGDYGPTCRFEGSYEPYPNEYLCNAASVAYCTDYCINHKGVDYCGVLPCQYDDIMGWMPQCCCSW